MLLFFQGCHSDVVSTVTPSAGMRDAFFRRRTKNGNLNMLGVCLDDIWGYLGEGLEDVWRYCWDVLGGICSCLFTGNMTYA